jgi:hypothetical protein
MTWQLRTPIVGAMSSSQADAISKAWNLEAAAVTYEKAADDAIGAMRASQAATTRNANFTSAVDLLTKAQNSWGSAGAKFKDVAADIAATSGEPSDLDLRANLLAVAAKDDGEYNRLKDRILSVKNEWRDQAEQTAESNGSGMGLVLTLAVAGAALGGTYYLGWWPAIARAATSTWTGALKLVRGR